MHDEGGENKISQFSNIISLFLNFLTDKVVYPFIGPGKGDEGADTDVTLPYIKKTLDL